MKVSLWRGVVILVVASAIPLFAQDAGLNPTVTVLPRATTPLPPDCVDGEPLAIAAREPATAPEVPQPTTSQREVETQAEAATTPEAESLPADLRSLLQTAQAAAAARDRDTFQAALAGAKAALPSATAAERSAAAGVIAVLDDIARLQEYQFNTPSGSFFDASVQGGSLLESLTRYAGYEEAIAPQTVSDAAGVRYYPTRESIDFLLRVAASRQGSGAIRAGESAVKAPSPGRVAAATPAPQPAPAEARRSKTSAPQASAPKTASPTTSARPSSPPQRPTKPRPAAATAAARPSPTPIPADESLVDQEPLVTESVVSTPADVQTGAAEPAPAPLTTATTEPAPPVATTADADPQASSEIAPRPPARRSIILPLVLILIGIGVLIVLFRASS